MGIWLEIPFQSLPQIPIPGWPGFTTGPRPLKAHECHLSVREESYQDWLDPSLLPSEVLGLITAYPQELLKDYPVDRLRGKLYPGNVPKIMEPRDYPELSTQQGSLSSCKF